jgi:hypothetical protein
VGVDQLVGRRRGFGEDAEPGEEVLAEEVGADLALGDEEAGEAARAVGTDDEVALETLLLAVMGEADRRAVAVDALDAGVGDDEPHVATVGDAAGDQVF